MLLTPENLVPNSGPILKLSFLTSYKDNLPGDWQDVTEDQADELFGIHDFRTEKDGHGYSPTRFDFCTGDCNLPYQPIGERHRATNHALEVSALVVDLDYGPSFDDVQDNYLYWIYSTHSHDPPAVLKFRVVLPFVSPITTVSTDEWRELYHELCKRLNIKGYDNKCANDIARLYYLPSAQPGKSVGKFKSDGEYLLDANAVLKELRDAKEAAALAKANLKPLAPVIPIDRPKGQYEGLPSVLLPRLEKTERDTPWTVEEVRDEIAKLAAKRARQPEKAALYNVLKAARDGTKLATAPNQPQEAGVESGRDGAIHRLVSSLAQSLSDTPPWEVVFEALRPAFLVTNLEPEGWDVWHNEAKEMYERRVRARVLLADKRRAELVETFVRELKTEDGEEPDRSWLGTLIMAGENGDRLDPCGDNIQTILKHAWGPRGIWFDAVRKEIRIDKGPAKGLDPKVAATKLSNWFYSTFRLKVPAYSIKDQIILAAMANTHDDLATYLRGLQWDGIPRLATWLKVYAGASDEGTSEYLKQVGTKWLIACVARALDPGCKVDTVMVLEGTGGMRKSKLFEVLGGNWFSDTTIDVESKDSKMFCSTRWIIELAELTGIRKGDVEAIKQYLAIRFDDFRPPYGEALKTFPRRCVFGATVNPKANNKYIMGDLGERRIWIVPCNRNIAYAELIRDRDQLWAEATHLYLQAAECERCRSMPIRCHDHRWWFEIEDWKGFNSITESRKVEESEVFEEAISEWWYRMAPANRPKQVSIYDVAKHALEIAPERCKTPEQIKIGQALRDLGFENKDRKVDGKRARYWVPVDSKLFSHKKGHLSTVEEPSANEAEDKDQFDGVDLS